MDNPASVVDEAAFSVSRSIRIAAPVEKVWAAITEPEHISGWFGRTVIDESGVGSMTWPGGYRVPLRVESVDAPRSVSYRWTNDDAQGDPPAEVDPLRSTVFTFTLEAVPEGTLLTVVETGFESTSDPLKNLEFHRQGWNDELDKLVALFGAAA
ncbi:MAG: hypothetical protein BGO97_05100 [Micrococcales bacterium 70-64]|nr:SRPBCC domain-containing protein [Leifsonia sp.]ODU63473.1 MAG: hypothetical protein ABT06_05105 [Leifsonia sp. SCN 70-46]OJX85164.1 MAG: hypothetical protein BGO97_05100 [Micrococcales bacterium 70-64]